MGILGIVRENERLKTQNEFLQKENERLEKYKSNMQKQWQNWWSFDGSKQDEG